MRWPTWDQFIKAWRALLGSGTLVYGVVVTARDTPASAPYVLVVALGLLGLSISIPLERKAQQQQVDGDDE